MESARQSDPRRPLLDEDALEGAELVRGVPSEGMDVQQPCSSIAAEVPRLLRLAVPVSAQAVISYIGQLITVAQVGRLGASELSAFSLATSLYNIMGLAVVIGVASAIETLAGQAFGAQQYALLGVLLQRGLLISALACAPPMLAWLQAQRLLLWMGQQPLLAEQAARALLVMAPGLPLDAAVQCCARYLSSQRLVQPAALISLAGLAVRPGLNHLLMHTAGLGLLGAPVGHVVVQGGCCCLYLVVVWVISSRQPAPRRTWEGWSWQQASGGWRSYLSVALPSLALVCLGWWPLELLTLMGGLLPDAGTAVAALGICFGTRALSWLAVGGLAAGVTIRTSNQLGAQQADGARASLAAALLLGAAVGACGFAAPLWLARRAWVGLFTQDAGVAALVLRCFPALLASLLGDSLDAVLGGAARGCGRQGLAAGVTLASYWLLGLPLAALLGLRLGHGAPGMWLALAVATSAQGAALGATMCALDWRREARAAARRVRAAAAAPTAEVPEEGLGQ